MEEKKIYTRTEFIACMFFLWFLIIPPLVGFIALYLQKKQERERDEKFKTALDIQLKYHEIGCERYEEVSKLVDLKNEKLISLNHSIEVQTQANIEIVESCTEMQNNLKNAEKRLETQKNKIKRIRELYKSVTYCIENKTLLEKHLQEELDELQSSEILELHCLDVKSLKKAYKENDKHITKLTDDYSSRYTTKANQAIYKLMTIALRSELQNILYSLKYKKLDEAIEKVKNMTAKYLTIAGNGNQSIAGTLTSFIGELEYFFIEAVKIEYNYYVKKEQARQEQLRTSSPGTACYPRTNATGSCRTESTRRCQEKNRKGRRKISF